MKRHALAYLSTVLALTLVTAPAKAAENFEREAHGGGQSHGGGGAPAPAHAGQAQHMQVHHNEQSATARPLHSEQQHLAHPQGGRTPSMSRADIRSNLPAAQHLSASQPAGRQASSPVREQVRSFLQQKSGTPVTPSAGQADLRTQAQRYLQQRAQSTAHDLKATVAKQRTPSGQAESRGGADHRLYDQIRHHRPEINSWFNDNFFAQHHYQPAYHHPGNNWWRGAQWGTLASWLGWQRHDYPFYANGGDYPLYGAEEYPVYVPYDEGGYPAPYPVYGPPGAGGYPAVDTSSYAAPPTYYPGYNQTQASNTTAAPATPSPGDWLPLGVFAAGTNAALSSSSSMFVQLAVDQAGDLAGTYYNAATNQTHPLEGVIDSQTQQAAWKVSDNPSSPLMVTAARNLTQATVPVQVHFPNDNEQNWVLVRIDTDQ